MYSVYLSCCMLIPIIGDVTRGGVAASYGVALPNAQAVHMLAMLQPNRISEMNAGD